MKETSDSGQLPIPIRKGGRLKLNEALAHSLKSRIAEGESLGLLANEAGVDYHTVYRLARGETWPNVEPYGDVTVRKRGGRSLTVSERDALYTRKTRKKLSNLTLAKEAGVSESTMSRAMRNAELVRAFRVQRYLMTSGNHALSMKLYSIDAAEADRLTSIAASSRLPRLLRLELGD